MICKYCLSEHAVFTWEQEEDPWGSDPWQDAEWGLEEEGLWGDDWGDDWGLNDEDWGLDWDDGWIGDWNRGHRGKTFCLSSQNTKYYDSEYT